MFLSLSFENRLTNVMKPRMFDDFTQVMDALIKFVDCILFVDSGTSLHDHLIDFINLCDGHRFTNGNKKFWLSCMTSLDKIRDYYEKPNSNDFKTAFYDRHLKFLL